MKEVDEHRVVLFPQQIIRIEREGERENKKFLFFNGILTDRFCIILYDAPYRLHTFLYF
jgi:hypothetical protein